MKDTNAALDNSSANLFQGFRIIFFLTLVYKTRSEPLQKFELLVKTRTNIITLTIQVRDIDWMFLNKSEVAKFNLSADDCRPQTYIGQICDIFRNSMMRRRILPVDSERLSLYNNISSSQCGDGAHFHSAQALLFSATTAVD